MNQLKTYADLTFNPHDVAGFDTHATMFFENGYGISVITGECAYGGLECAVMVGTNDEDSALCYDSGITDDVMGWQTPESITEVMAQIQQLEAR